MIFWWGWWHQIIIFNEWMNALSLLGTLKCRRPHPLSSNNFCQSCNPDYVLVNHSTETTPSTRINCSTAVLLLLQTWPKALGEFSEVRFGFDVVFADIACYAERCIRYSRLRSVRPSVRLSHAGTVSKRLKLRSRGLHCGIAPWLVSLCLTSPQNAKGNTGSEGAKWERGRKNRQFLANTSPYLGNGAR